MEKGTIGKRIKDLRKDSNLTQPDLAGKLEELRMKYYPDLKPITRNDIANWEDEKDDFKSKRTLIKASDVHLLSLVFGVDCDYIITGIRKADETIVDELGLSQKLIDELKIDYADRQNDPEQGWAWIFNYLCENGLYQIMELFLAFFQDDYTKNPYAEIGNLISKQVADGKLEETDNVIYLRNFIMSESHIGNRLREEAQRFAVELMKEYMIVHDLKEL